MSELGLQHQNAAMNCSSYGWLINIPALLFDISGKCGEIGNLQVFNTKAPAEYCHWKSHISVSGLLHLETYHLLSADSFIKQASKQSSNLSIHPFIIYQPIEINLSMRPACIFLCQIPANQHYSIPRVFGQIQRPKSKACVLCDSHIFHLTAERAGKYSKACSNKPSILCNSAIWPLVQVAHKNERQGAWWKMHRIEKKKYAHFELEIFHEFLKIRLSEGPAGPSKNMSCFRRAWKSHLESTNTIKCSWCSCFCLKAATPLGECHKCRKEQ